MENLWKLSFLLGFLILEVEHKETPVTLAVIFLIKKKYEHTFIVIHQLKCISISWVIEKNRVKQIVSFCKSTAWNNLFIYKYSFPLKLRIFFNAEIFIPWGTCPKIILEDIRRFSTKQIKCMYLHKINEKSREVEI